MKYTDTLWNGKQFQYYLLIKGKYRSLIRFLCLPLILLVTMFFIGLSFTTVPTDLYRNYKACQLKYMHFEKNYKPYVLQQYLDYGI